jgi:para-nitrobenzyl esterase
MKSNRGLPFAPVINGYVLAQSINEAAESGNINKVPTMIDCTKNDITVTEEEAKTNTSRILERCIGWSLINEAKSGNAAYVYHFTHLLPGDNAGAFHSAELWYMFGTLCNCWRPMGDKDYRLSEKMLEYWSNFAATGNPNGKETETWKKCTSDRFVMEF